MKFYLEFDTQETKYRFVIFSCKMFLFYTLRRITLYFYIYISVSKFTISVVLAIPKNYKNVAKFTTH